MVGPTNHGLMETMLVTAAARIKNLVLLQGGNTASTFGDAKCVGAGGNSP